MSQATPAMSAASVKPTSLPISELLSSRSPAVVPQYQRAYAWEDDQVTDLINDVKLLLPTPTKSRGHFYGGMVAIRTDDAAEPSGYFYRYRAKFSGCWHRARLPARRLRMRSASKRPRLRGKGGGGMSEPRYPSGKSVEVVVALRAYRDQAAIFGPHAKPGFSINGQVGDNHQDAVVSVPEVLNQFRHGFTEGDVPEYAEAFRQVLDDLMAKHWQEGT